ERSRSPALLALQRNFEQGIAPEEGLEAFQRILGAAGLAQVVATTLDLEGLRQQTDALVPLRDALEELPAGDEAPEEDGAQDRAAAPDAIERTLVSFWQELL